MNTRLLTEALKTDMMTAYRRFAERAIKKMALIKKLEQANIKHDKDTIIAIDEDRQGKIIFLERGNAEFVKGVVA
jgi:hypothetical protein